MKDKHQRGGRERSFPGNTKAGTKISKQGKAGFKNKTIIINNNKLFQLTLNANAHYFENALLAEQ